MTLFEKLGWHEVRCMDEATLCQGQLDGCDVLAVSGGDTFAIAEALGPAGAGAIRTFIENGGIYLGACAGAYLAMNSSKSPLSLFNWAPVKIANLSRLKPPAAGGPQAEKFAMAYGCDFVFHPVRDEVRLALDGKGATGDAPLAAPMFGGPAMVADLPVEVMARYAGFTPKTLFLAPRSRPKPPSSTRPPSSHLRLERENCFCAGPIWNIPGFPRQTVWWPSSSPAGAGHRRTVAGPGQTPNRMPALRAPAFFTICAVT
jgi:hypothetical protein